MDTSIATLKLEIERLIMAYTKVEMFYTNSGEYLVNIETDWEGVRSSVQNLICNLLENIGYKEIADIFSNLPLY